MPSRQTNIFHYVLHSAALLEERLRARLEPLGITPRQARVLVAMSRMGPVSQITLGQEFRVKAASMSTMTTRLIANGHIQRSINPNDKRANVLELTEAGRAFLDQIHEAWQDVDEVILEALGEEDTAPFAASAKALRDALGGFAPGRVDTMTDEDDA